MAATDDSSALSETRRSNITIRDGGLLCSWWTRPCRCSTHCGSKRWRYWPSKWTPLLLLYAKSNSVSQVAFIRSLAPSLQHFRKDDPSNPLCCECQLSHGYLDCGCLSTACPLHQRQYYSALFVFVPSKFQRKHGVKKSRASRFCTPRVTHTE